MNENRRILLGSLVGLATVGASIRFAKNAQAAIKDNWQFVVLSPYSCNTAFITDWNPDDPPGLGRFRVELRGGEILHDNAPWPSGKSYNDKSVATVVIRTAYAGTGNSDSIYHFQILADDKNDVPKWNKRGDVRYVVLEKNDNKWIYPGNMKDSPSLSADDLCNR